MTIFAFHIGFLNFGLIDIIDIALVSVLLYQIYRLVRGSVAVRILLGLTFIYLFYLVINATGMQLLGAILGQFIGVGVLAAVILFQQEIRKFLLLIGNTTNFENSRLLSFLNVKKEEGFVDVNVIVKAAQEMGKTFTGALIVMERSSNLQSYMDSGDELDAVLSKRLLLSIFNKTSPLHDGAVIIKNGRINAARCIIPVSENQFLPANLGLRHRAAIGISEITDCMVLIVSEENGKISLAHDGKIEYGLDPVEIRSKLNHMLHEDPKKPATEASSVTES